LIQIDPELAKELEHPSPQFVDSMLDPTSTKWSLVLDHDDRVESRPVPTDHIRAALQRCQ